MTDSALQPILCLLGHPAAGSPMQLAMERAFASANLDWRYLTLDVAPDQLGAALAGIAALGFRGAHLTGALTKAAKPLVHQVQGSAELAQWVDCVTVSRSQGRTLVGENLWGRVVAELTGGASDSNDTAFLIGDSADMIAVAAELALTGWTKIYVESLDAETAAVMNTNLSSPVIESRRAGKRFPPGVKLLIHGLDSQGNVSPFDLANLERMNDLTQIIDLTLPHVGSPLLRASRGREIPCVSALEVMVQYTASCFRHWTSVAVDQEVIRETFEEYYDI